MKAVNLKNLFQSQYLLGFRFKALEKHAFLHGLNNKFQHLLLLS